MIQERVMAGIRMTNPATPLTVILYCFAASTPRVDLREQEFVRTLGTFAPVIVVYTKTYSEGITDCFDKYFDELTMPLPIRCRVPIYARSEPNGEPRSRGLPTLARLIASVYPEAVSQV